VTKQQRRRAVTAARSRRNAWFIWSVVAIVAVGAIAIAVAAASGSGDTSAQATKWEIAPVTTTGSPLVTFPGDGAKDPAVGQTIPTLSGVSIFDGSRATVQPNGRPQVVVFVAHWCPHCQAEVPRLVTLAKQGALDGIDVTAVATGTNSGYPNYPPSAWLKGVGWKYPVLADSSRWAAANAYGLRSYPLLVFVTAGGKVAGRLSGEIPPSLLQKIFTALRNGKALPLAGANGNSSSTR
jgi:cytochrome c biogenesis protein CcmG/thiol:disulfide interchange protein DsbE